MLFTQISCRKDLDFEGDNNITFRFSQDTVFLDTVFTKANSETFLLKIFNDSDKDVLISEMYLKKRNQSNFRINVDGRKGFEFNEVALRGKDSLMVFIEIALGDSQRNWLAEDEIVIGKKQEIKLLAAVEDAIYYYPKPGEDYFEIENDTQWNSNKAHIIYGKLKIKENMTLHIDAGTKVYFHQGSLMQLDRNAQLVANGTKDAKIIFRTDRQTLRYDTLPNQWESLKLLPKSNLDANYLTIRGANNGLEMNNATASLNNVEIYNAGSSGIFSDNSSIVGKNVVISEAADASLNIENGGNYNFYYSTFANQGKVGVVGSTGPQIPLYLSDYTLENEKTITHPLQALFVNSIFYGRYNNGVVLDFENENHITLSFESCLIKNEDKTSLDYKNSSGFNHIWTEDPKFISNLFSDQNLRLQDDSPARNQANPMYIHIAPIDLDGTKRGNSSNLGAYD